MRGRYTGVWLSGAPASGVRPDRAPFTLAVPTIERRVNCLSEITAHHSLFKDTNLHVEDTGGAWRPAVLIHGWPLSRESFSNNVLVLLDAGYR